MTMHAAQPALLVPESLGATPIAPSDIPGLTGAAPLGPVLADAGDAPWHDPSLAIDERLKMAESRPLAPRLMAAMAQQDCGQCGYNCADYANALFLKKEERLNLCAPGGKETFRLLKKLAEELESAKAEARPAAAAIVA